MSRLLEICVDNWQSAVNAETGGADRIELCSALSEDGLTPSIGFAKKCVEDLSIPIFPMIRPRKGDFNYSKEEIQIMIEDIHQLKAAGVHGIVVGVLQKDRQINEIALRRFINAARPLPVTFHRAFDYTIDPYNALNTLINLKIERVLTSGQQKTAVEGKEMLKELVDQAAGQIVIMPGSGIKSSNISELVETGALEYHGSARPSGSLHTDVDEVLKIKELM